MKGCWREWLSWLSTPEPSIAADPQVYSVFHFFRGKDLHLFVGMKTAPITVHATLFWQLSVCTSGHGHSFHICIFAKNINCYTRVPGPFCRDIAMTSTAPGLYCSLPCSFPQHLWVLLMEQDSTASALAQCTVETRLRICTVDWGQKAIGQYEAREEKKNSHYDKQDFLQGTW